jgi:O-antigen/teichoic acid export membrane protein
VVRENDVPASTVGGTRAVARNASFLLAGQVASSVLSAILTAVLGRWLGVAEFGIYYLLAVVSGFAYVFVDWGQGAYLIRQSARHHGRDSQLLGGALVFRVAVTLLAAPTTAVLMRLIGYGSRTEFLALFSVACGLPLALSQAYSYMFRARDRMDRDAIITVTAKALIVTVTVPAVILGGGLVSVVFIQAVGGAGALLVAVLLAREFHLKAQRPRRATLNELARGGAPIAAFVIAQAVQPFIDVIVLSKLTSPEVVGWYGAARNIMGLLIAPAVILGGASLPELSRVSGSVPDLRRALRSSLRLLLGVGAMAAAGTFLFANVAVYLIYGKDRFDQAAVLLQFFAPVLPRFFMSIFFGTAITAAGKMKEIAVAKALSVVLTTGLDFLLIPICQSQFGDGAIGLVLAFAAGEVLMLTAYLWLLPRGALDRGALMDLLRAAAAACGTAVIFWALPPITPWAEVPAYAVVFMALALASGLVLTGDLKKVAYLIQRKL